MNKTSVCSRGKQPCVIQSTHAYTIKSTMTNRRVDTSIHRSNSHLSTTRLVELSNIRKRLHNK